MNVLIVEDEVRLAEALAQIMTEQKYTVDVVHDGEDGLAYAEMGDYDVIVLDVMLPKRNGFEVVRALRAKKIATPVLLLTARDEITDKVTGLDCGADDYMTKPFSPEELFARVRALTRRQGDVILEEMKFSDVTLNLSSYTLQSNSKSVHLGFKEFEVMRLLLNNPSMIMPKEELITKVWGTESGAEDNNVEAYISFLRKKLAFIGSKVTIGTVRKVGYRLEETIL
ncbi:response regulator transcription factor [Clostridium merdae]|uniref:response regulator transcription factor n=1 Tax=Clostridium merdae TaxID=1958780 RepID=UPI000A269811|nr:response regulator transcription factor [Clostridium merdae]